MPDLAAELVALVDRGEVAVDQQVRGLEEGRLVVIGELGDVVTAVAEDPEIAVDEGDGRLGGARVHVAVVEGDQARLRPQLADVDSLLVLAALDDGEL